MSSASSRPEPCTYAEVEDAAIALTGGIDEEDLAGVALVAVAARDDGALDVILSDGPGPSATAALDQLTSGPHRVLGLACRVGWAPTAEEPTSTSWLAVVVGGEVPVWAAIRRDQDRAWRLLSPNKLPWFAASTAAALRTALTEHAPLSLKIATDPRLFGQPGEGEPPPTDDRGNI